MKMIDTKSLFIGAGACMLTFMLTSGKVQTEENSLEVFSKENLLVVFNKQTKTVYQYGPKLTGGIQETPGRSFKLSPDGSTLTNL